MTIQEYWDKNKKYSPSGLLDFEFSEEFGCWIQHGKVWMQEYHECEFELKHIKTIEDYKLLFKLLVGEDMKIK